MTKFRLTRLPGRDWQRASFLRCARWALGGLLLGSFVLGACATLPTSGTPKAFDVEVPSPTEVNFVAGAPVKGASAEVVVEGFLRACAAGMSDDFATARLFLTKDSAQKWRPEAGIDVYSTDATPLVAPDAQADTPGVFVSVPLLASVDEKGNLQEAAGGQTLKKRFQVREEDGEWRIVAPEDGIILSLASFQASYQLSHVYFPMLGEQSMAFDAHWYPRKNLIPKLMSALTDGPSQELAPTVEDGIPAGAVLTAEEGEGGQVEVSLRTPTPLSDSARMSMAAQVVYTLRQSAQVSAVSLTVNGEQMESQELSSGVRFRLDSAIAQSERGAGLIVSGEFSPLRKYVPSSLADGVNSPTPAAETPEERWDFVEAPSVSSRLAVSPIDHAIISWVGEGRLVTVDRSSKHRQSVELAQGAWPSVDRFGWTWSVDRSGAFVLIQPEGMISALSGKHLVEGLTSVRISPDGSRALMMRRLGEDTGAWLGTVERDADGTPLGVVSVAPIPRLSFDIRDISWASSTSVVALQGAPGEDAVVVVVPLGGFSQSMPAPLGAHFVTAGSSPASVFVVDDKGGVWLRVNTTWQPVEVSVEGVRFPG